MVKEESFSRKLVISKNVILILVNKGCVAKIGGKVEK